MAISFLCPFVAAAGLSKMPTFQDSSWTSFARLDSGQNRWHCSAPPPSPLPVTHGDVGTPRFSPYCSLFYLRRLSALLSVLVFVHPSPRFCVSSSNHSPWVMSFTSVTSATIPLRDTPNSVFSHDLVHELLTSLSDFLQVVCSQGPLNFFS